jgi:hypothetical protein
MSNERKSGAENEPISNDNEQSEEAAKQRFDYLLLATDSAIQRLKNLSESGGEVDSMDIKDLKSFISSIKELSTLSNELSPSKESGGVVILPEVKKDE